MAEEGCDDDEAPKKRYRTLAVSVKSGQKLDVEGCGKPNAEAIVQRTVRCERGGRVLEDVRIPDGARQTEVEAVLDGALQEAPEDASVEYSVIESYDFRVGTENLKVLSDGRVQLKDEVEGWLEEKEQAREARAEEAKVEADEKND